MDPPDVSSVTPEVPCEVDIAIIGGGLGGLALAAGLHQRGFHAHVFEGSPSLRSQNSTMIALGPNALTALGSIHPALPDDIRERGVKLQRSVMKVLQAGKDPIIHERSGSDLRSISIRWVETQKALAAQVPHEYVHYDYAATGYEEITEEGQGSAANDPSTGPAVRAVVHFRNKPSVTARLVVGADGVFSAIRAAMFPNDPGPRYLGHMGWNCLLQNSGNAVVDANAPGEVMIAADNPMSSSETQSLHMLVCDVGGGCTFWQVRMATDEPAYTKDMAEAEGTGGSAPSGAGSSRNRGGLGVPGSKQRVLERLKAAGWDFGIPLVEATPESIIYERALFDRVPLERWASPGGRVVLLGDAAHAMHTGPGQGARMCFEDAHQLVLAVEALWPDVPAALDRYQQARIARANTVKAYATQSAGISALREAVMPKGLTYPQILERQREFFDWLDQYPEHANGDPNSKWWKPEVVSP